MSDSDRLAACRLLGPHPGGAAGRVSTAVRRFLVHAIPPGQEERAGVLLAVSGGRDSMALAVCAVDICARRGLVVRALTVDHGLREGSAREADEVAHRLAGLGADARVAAVDAGAPGGGPEAAARRARREALEREALRLRRDAGADRVLVLLGHTMDDQAETVLLRLARGSGVGSLRAMDPLTVWEPGRVEAGRPLLGIRRRDTGACCEQLGLAWVEDPTNSPDGPWRASDGSALRRSAVRSRALPALAEALGVDPVPALARTARMAALDDDALEEQAGLLWERAVKVVDAAGGAAGGGALVLDCAADALAQAPAAVRDRVLHRAILAAGGRSGDVTSEHVGRVSALVAAWNGQGSADLPGLTARRLPGGAVRLAPGRPGERGTPRG